MRRAQAPSAIGCKGLSVRSLTARYESDIACSDADIQGGKIGRDQGTRCKAPARSVIHTQVFDAQLLIRKRAMNILVAALGADTVRPGGSWTSSHLMLHQF